ncbi:MAG: 4-hydroxy-tetrahydrodipicolinate reductase [Actinomycetota bacterium]|nr:4-hydroxy-tetrahydrodipicolinate reductase [Actinomycetota bacterium]
MIDVLIAGAAGRMGSEVVRAVTAAQDMRVAAAVDPANEGLTVPDGQGGSVTCSADLDAAIRTTNPSVMVDFTHPTVVEANLAVALGAGVDCVVGTTGLPETRLAELAEGAPKGTCLFMAPNFAVGAVLMMRFAAQAAIYMPHVEIIELHHDQKADAPSGTAMLTASLIAGARSTVPSSPGMETEIAEGARGASVHDVSVHSVRLPGMVAHQEVLFGGQGQTLSIRHDSIDRTSFMPGVIMACREVGSRSGLVIGLDRLMEE